MRAIHSRSRWLGIFTTVTVGLIVGLGLLLPAAASGDSPADAALRRLLDAADIKGPHASAEAERRFSAALPTSSDQRLVRHAYGVVLVKLFKLDQARIQFMEAAKAGKSPYPPAWRAWLYTELQLRRWQAGATAALAFSDALTTQTGGWPNEAALIAEARWLGQAVSATQLLVTTVEDVKLWLDVDRRIRQKLPDSLLENYSQAFDETAILQSTLAAEFEAARQAAQSELGDRQERTRLEVIDQQRQTESARENLKSAVKTQKRTLDNQIAEFAKQLGLLEKEWNTLDERRKSLERAILLINQEMTVLQQQYQSLSAQNQNSERPSILVQNRLQLLDQQLGSRQVQLMQHQTNRLEAVKAMGTVHQGATEILARRQTAVADYERQTGEILKRDEQLEKWKSRLEKKVEDLEESPEGNTSEVKSRERKLQTLGTYLPWDGELERQRLLTELVKE